eukprot:6205739-Pleurochrysis_carterae.AAC.1
MDRCVLSKVYHKASCASGLVRRRARAQAGSCASGGLVLTQTRAQVKLVRRRPRAEAGWCGGGL